MTCGPCSPTSMAAYGMATRLLWKSKWSLAALLSLSSAVALGMALSQCDSYVVGFPRYQVSAVLCVRYVVQQAMDCLEGPW